MNETEVLERLAERDVAWLRQLTEESAEGSVIDQIMAVAKRHHWHFKVERYQEMIDGEIREGNWTHIPLEQETAEIPGRAMRRIPAIERETGITPIGVIVAHEDEIELTEEQIAHRELLKKVAIGLGVITAVAVFIAVLAWATAAPVEAAATTTAAGTGTGTAVAAAALVALAVADPKLIIVVETERGPCWVTVCDWR